MKTGEIKRATLGGAEGGEEGGGPRAVAGGAEGGRALALDWAARLLYYGAGGALAVADLRGERTAYLHAGTMGNLSSLAVDPRRYLNHIAHAISKQLSLFFTLRCE